MVTGDVVLFVYLVRTTFWEVQHTFEGVQVWAEGMLVMDPHVTRNPVKVSCSIPCLAS
jgi:hypothetical protein